MSVYKVFLFDLNGTMIDDMQFHITAWHKILNDLGATISLEETKLQCYGKNHELLDRVFPGRFEEEEKDSMSIKKEKVYQEAFLPHLKLIDGLPDFLKAAQHAGIKMAIGSAAIMFNIDFVVDGLNIRTYFDAIVSADDVMNSKPDPETFLKCAAQLNVAPENCLVFEDSPKGTEAARLAGMQCVGITTMHTSEEFNNENIIRFIDTYSSELFQDLIKK